MIKKDIVKIVAETANIKNDKAEYVVNEVLNSIKNALSAGENVEIRGFGLLKPVVRKQKVAHNFQKGTSVVVPEKKDVRFVKSKAFCLDEKYF